MKTIYTYWKSSNNSDVILKQEFTETKINFPICYYRNGKEIKVNDLKGYVEIKKKKYIKTLKQ